jgi:hypothetical protein
LDLVLILPLDSNNEEELLVLDTVPF